MWLDNAYALNGQFLGLHPMASLFLLLPLIASCLDLILHTHTHHSKLAALTTASVSPMLWVLVQVWPFHPACTYGGAVSSGQALAHA